MIEVKVKDAIKATESYVPDIANVTTEDLSNAGSTLVTLGFRAGDVIEFFSAEEYKKEGMIKVRNFGTGSEYLVVCVRNSVPSLFSMSDLRRRDVNMTGVGKFRQKMLSQFSNDYERLNYLAGKSLTASTELISYEAPKEFVEEIGNDGKPTGKRVPAKDAEGNVITRTRTCPEITE